MTREQFEAALDGGQLQTKIVRAVSGVITEKWYDCRRNGKTKTWKTNTARFEIPIKYRLRDCARITDSHFRGNSITEWFRIKPTE